MSAQNAQNPDSPTRIARSKHHFSQSSTIIPGLLLLLDLAAILVGGIVPYLSLVTFNPYTLEYYAFAVGFVGLVAPMLLRQADLYQINAIMRPVARSDSVLIALVTAFLMFLTVAYALKASDIYSWPWIYSFGATTLVLLLSFRLLAFRVLLGMARRQSIGRTLVVLGAGTQGKEYLRRIRRVRPYFMEVAGVYDPGWRTLEKDLEGFPVLGGIEELIEAARQAKIDDVVIAMPWNAESQVNEMVQTLKELPVNVFISTDLVGFQLAFRPVLGSFRELPMFEVVQRPISGWSYLIKRAEDYVLATVALVLFSPLLLVVAAAIRIDSPGPVLFRQPRLGFNNQRFDIFKFRSMHHTPVPEGQVRQATRNDPRITAVGRFIRRTSIDELPQLLNVLNGTMSLVGPRPHALSHNEDFARQVRGYFARHRVKPGMTGWAQVNGLRGEIKTVEKLQARTEHDLYYAENWSLLFDLRILVMSLWVVVMQKNAV